MQIKPLVLAAMLVTMTSTVHAQTQNPAATPGIDKRQDVQQQRIDKGVESGQLNGREASRLERHQQHIQNMETKAKADGSVSKNERARIHHAQDQESRHIRREKHDRQHVN